MGASKYDVVLKFHVEAPDDTKAQGVGFEIANLVYRQYGIDSDVTEVIEID